MKEATGELNMTVVVLTMIGLLMAFFFYTVWPSIKANFVSNTNCAKAICRPCSDGTTTCKTRTFYLKDENKTFECVNKG